MKYILDTTAFSGAMRRDGNQLEILKKHSPSSIVTDPPIVAEINFGVERLNKSTKKSLLLKSEKDCGLSIVSVFPWIPESSDNFGRMADLEHRCELIDDFDIAIAAIALSYKCAVITSKPKYFQRITNLECIGWAD